MGIFGWSYPPGCSSVPGDEDSGPCEVCGQHVDSGRCVCPECPSCGAQGDPTCYWALKDGARVSNPYLEPCGADLTVDRYQEAGRHATEVALEAAYRAEAEYWEREAARTDLEEMTEAYLEDAMTPRAVSLLEELLTEEEAP